jgi:hypothetical protein
MYRDAWLRKCVIDENFAMKRRVQYWNGGEGGDFVALGAKWHFPGHYSWHTASHNKVLERRHHAAKGHYKEHSPSVVKKVGPSNAPSCEQSTTMGQVNTHRVLWWPLHFFVIGKEVLDTSSE